MKPYCLALLMYHDPDDYFKISDYLKNMFNIENQKHIE